MLEMHCLIANRSKCIKCDISAVALVVLKAVIVPLSPATARSLGLQCLPRLNILLAALHSKKRLFREGIKVTKAPLFSFSSPSVFRCVTSMATIVPPSALFPVIEKFLVENGLKKAAKAFRKESNTVHHAH